MISTEDIHQLHQQTSASISDIQLVSNTFPCFIREEIYDLIYYADFRRSSVAHHVELMLQLAA